MRPWIAFVLGLLLGVATVWWLHPGRFRHAYETTRPIQLVDRGSGQRAGVLPTGALLLSPERLRRAPDLGWWGCVPVVFDDMWAAGDMGVAPAPRSDASLWERGALHATSTSDGDDTSSVP